MPDPVWENDIIHMILLLLRLDMLFDRGKAFRTHVMLHLAGVGDGDLRIHAEAYEPFGNDLVAFVNHFGDLATGIGQINKSLFCYRDMIVLPEILHCDADAGFLESHFLRYVHRTHDGVAFAQNQYGFQIIFGRFIHCHVTFTSFLYGCIEADCIFSASFGIHNMTFIF